jgi:outer membrane protein TolC
MNYRATVVLIAAGWMTGCMAGPNYHRPAVQAPQTFRAPDPLPAPQAESFADLKWWDVFKDADLQQLVSTALQQNYDLREAFTRVEAARASLGITRSDQFPQVGVSGDLQFTRLSRGGSFTLPRSLVASQKIAILARRYWTCCHSRWTSGAVYAARPKPREQLF